MGRKNRDELIVDFGNEHIGQEHTIHSLYDTFKKEGNPLFNVPKFKMAQILRKPKYNIERRPIGCGFEKRLILYKF